MIILGYCKKVTSDLKFQGEVGRERGEKPSYWL